MRSLPVPVLGFLLVSFRPYLLRSRNRSTGDPLLVFPPGPVPDFRFPSASFRPLPSRFRFSISLLSLCFFLSALPGLASQWLSPCSVPLSLPCSPPFSQLNLLSLLPGFSYSASCLFPFALPRFAPTAVPRVLTSSSRFRSFPLPLRSLSLASLLIPAIQLSCSSVPLFPVLPHSCFPGAAISAFASLAFR